MDGTGAVSEAGVYDFLPKIALKSSISPYYVQMTKAYLDRVKEITKEKLTVKKPGSGQAAPGADDAPAKPAAY